MSSVVISLRMADVQALRLGATGLETLRAARRLGYDGAELGWTTEDNELMNRAIESIGARRYKTYRIYEKAL